MAGKREYTEYIGCIEVHENVFIGAGSRICPMFRLAPMSVATNLVNKDVTLVIVRGPAKVMDL